MHRNAAKRWARALIADGGRRPQFVPPPPPRIPPGPPQPADVPALWPPPLRPPPPEPFRVPMRMACRGLDLLPPSLRDRLREEMRRDRDD